MSSTRLPHNREKPNFAGNPIAATFYGMILRAFTLLLGPSPLYSSVRCSNPPIAQRSIKWLRVSRTLVVDAGDGQKDKKHRGHNYCKQKHGQSFLVVRSCFSGPLDTVSPSSPTITTVPGVLFFSNSYLANDLLAGPTLNSVVGSFNVGYPSSTSLLTR